MTDGAERFAGSTHGVSSVTRRVMTSYVQRAFSFQNSPSSFHNFASCPSFYCHLIPLSPLPAPLPSSFHLLRPTSTHIQLKRKPSSSPSRPLSLSLPPRLTRPHISFSFSTFFFADTTLPSILRRTRTSTSGSGSRDDIFSHPEAYTHPALAGSPRRCLSFPRRSLMVSTQNEEDEEGAREIERQLISLERHQSITPQYYRKMCDTTSCLKGKVLHSSLTRHYFPERRKVSFTHGEGNFPRNEKGRKKETKLLLRLGEFVPDLEELELISPGLSEKSVCELFDSIEVLTGGCCPLRVLHLNSLFAHDEEVSSVTWIESLSLLLEACPSLYSFSLSSCGLLDDEMSIICGSLSRSPSLSILNFDHNRMTHEAVSSLILSLRASGAKLHTLSLSRCFLSMESIEMLCAYLGEEQPQLRVLRLGRNRGLSREECSLSLSLFLPRLCFLESLSLSGLHISLDVAKALQTSLPSLSHLSHLDLSDIKVENDSLSLCFELCEAIGRCPSLYSLSLLRSLFEAPLATKTARDIEDIDYVERLTFLLEALRKCPFLYSLSLSGCKSDPLICDLLKAHTRNCRLLSFLLLDRPQFSHTSFHRSFFKSSICEPYLLQMVFRFIDRAPRERRRRRTTEMTIDEEKSNS